MINVIGSRLSTTITIDESINVGVLLVDSNVSSIIDFCGGDDVEDISTYMWNLVGQLSVGDKNLPSDGVLELSYIHGEYSFRYKIFSKEKEHQVYDNSLDLLKRLSILPDRIISIRMSDRYVDAVSIFEGNAVIESEILNEGGGMVYHEYIIDRETTVKKKHTLLKIDV